LHDKIFRVPTPSPSDRKHAPIFLMGCHRSGTNLLYAFLGSKLWLKLHTAVGRLANMSALELEEDSVQVAESARS
jgi:hypothetical protein